MGVYQPIQPISLAFPQPVTALSFDPVSDILWAGTNSGHVISYCSPQGLRGVSYRAGDLAVQKLCSGESYVRALCASANGLGSWAKGGMNKWFYKCVPTASYTILWLTVSVSVPAVHSPPLARQPMLLTPLLQQIHHRSFLCSMASMAQSFAKPQFLLSSRTWSSHIPCCWQGVRMVLFVHTILGQVQRGEEPQKHLCGHIPVGYKAFRLQAISSSPSG